jgi:hypothetical protein
LRLKLFSMRKCALRGYRGFRDGLVLGLAMSIGPTVGEASGPHQLIHTGGSLDPVTAEFRGGHLHDAIRCVLARMRHSVWSAPRRTRTRCMAAGDSPPRAGGIGSALSERPGSIADTSRAAISPRLSAGLRTLIGVTLFGLFLTPVFYVAHRNSSSLCHQSATAKL